MEIQELRRQKRQDRLIYASIALLMLAILLIFSGKKSFFTDELHQIGLLESVDSLPALIRLHASTEREVAPPLFAVLAWVWYRIVPYGQAFLQLLPALLTCAGVYVVGLAGRTAGGRLVGVFSALLALLAPAVSLTAGMQFRQYGALFLFAALTTYLYILRNRQRGSEKWSVLVLYGVVMAALPYTHYVSALLPVGFFLIDAVLLVQKRLRPRCLLSYVIGGGLFFPWALSILRSVATRNEFWIDKPRIHDLLDALYFLTDGKTAGPLFFLFLLGCCLALAGTIYRRLLHTPCPSAIGHMGALACVPFFMLGCVFVYSAYCSDTVSLFLPRYFICVIPAILLVAGDALARLFFWLATRSAPAARMTAALTLCLLLAALCTLRLDETVRTDVATVTEPYREAADYLSDRPDVRDQNVAVVTSNLSAYVTAGWESYYVTQGGARASFEIFDYVRLPKEADAQQYDVLYTFVEHAALPPETQYLLNTFYEKDGACTDGTPWRVTRYIRRSDMRQTD